MTASWEEKDPDGRRQSEELFDVLSNMDRITRAMRSGEGAGAIGFAQVYEFATNPAAVMTAELSAALQDNERLSRDLDALLSRTAIYQFPRVAAASSGAVDSREGDGFTLKIKESRAGADQLYIILELNEYLEDDPVALVLRGEGGFYLKEALPVPVNGRIQMLAESGSDLVTALRDVKTELFLQ